MEPAAKRMALANVTVEDADTLDCGICYLPLKPPVFQCVVGHTICSRCRDMMAAARRCHACHVRIPGGYRRNIALEKLLESIRVPCANAAHGCTATPVYYDHSTHLKACPHAPCYCPQAHCGFAGSTAALLNHFADTHGWPCTTELRAWTCVEVQLRDGFNAIMARAQGRQYLFLLNVTWNPYGRAVSVLCLHPRASPAAPCSLEFEVRLRYCCNINHRGDMCLGHNQETTFKVGCTDLSGGLPSSEDSFRFFLPKYVHPHDIHTITVSFDVLRVSMDGGVFIS